MRPLVVIALVLIAGLAPSGRLAAQEAPPGPPPGAVREGTQPGPNGPGALTAGLAAGGGRLPRRGKLVMLSGPRGYQVIRN